MWRRFVTRALPKTGTHSWSVVTIYSMLTKRKAKHTTNDFSTKTKSLANVKQKMDMNTETKTRSMPII